MDTDDDRKFQARLNLERAAQRDVIRLIKAIECRPVFITDTTPLPLPPFVTRQITYRIRRKP
jgi:hypothetical protein